MTNVKSLLALYVKMGGSLTDTYSDIAGGIPVGQYSLISDAILACSKKYSSGGGSYTLPTASADTKGGVKIGSGLTMTGEVLSATGGGAEKFVVTLTADDSGAETVWTADKTVAEIIEAHADNELVVAQWEEEGATHEASLSLVQDSEGESVVGFAAVDVENRVLTAGGIHDDADTWFVESKSIRNVALPEYSPSNNGQVLGISSGAPAWVYGNAPLIVTLTEDQNTGNLVGDKSYKEVYDAVDGGQPVTFKSAFGGFTVATNALSVGLSNGGYSVALVFGGSIKETEGAENDNITITVNG